MNALHLSAGILALGLVAGCGGAPSTGGTATVTGSVSRTTRPLDNARALAIGADGRSFWAYLDAAGAFALKLPVGQSYRVLVADALAGGGQRTVGHLVVHPTTGATRWIGLRVPGTVVLGALHLTPSTGLRRGGTIGLLDDPQAGSEGSQEDVDTHEDDHEGDGLCSTQGTGEEDDQELDASNEPGDAYADDQASEHEQESDNEDGAACPPAGGASSSSGSSGGSAGPGGACTTNADCSAGLVCAAAICQHPPV